MTFCSVISLNSNWGMFQILYRIISSGEIIICENAKRVIYDRYRLQVGEKLEGTQRSKDNREQNIHISFLITEPYLR